MATGDVIADKNVRPSLGIQAPDGSLVPAAGMVVMTPSGPVPSGSPVDGAQLASSLRRLFVENFATQVGFTSRWDVLASTGVVGAAFNGTGDMLVTLGMAANAEYRIRSKMLFSLPCVLGFVLALSQRIANQELYVRLISEDGLDWTGLKFDAALATDVKVGSYGDGMGALTNYSSFSMNTVTQLFYELEVDVNDVNGFWRVVNNASARNNLLTRTLQLPDPNKRYFVEIWFRNLAATASNTLLTLSRLTNLDLTNHVVSVREGYGSNNAAQAIPVNVTTGVSGMSLYMHLQNQRTEYVDSIVNLAASAALAGTTRDSGSSTVIKGTYALARAYADQAGTLFIEQSRDGTTWRSAPADSIAVAAATVASLRVPLLARYWRVRYVNGATATTAFELISAFSQN